MKAVGGGRKIPATFAGMPGFQGINTFISMKNFTSCKFALAAGLTVVVGLLNPLAAVAILTGAGIVAITLTDYAARRPGFARLAV